MEAAAAVIAVITISLQSTKVVYQSINDIKDGPEIVEELAARTGRLEEILQQLRQLIQDQQGTIDANDVSIWTPLESQVSQCRDYLQKVEVKLSTFALSNARHGFKKTWRSMKTILNKQELSRISNQIQHRVATLDLQVAIISR